jgi:energy-coupling factor transporter ATP-binding protein EcfA2
VLKLLQLEDAAEKAVSKYSKGMAQRIGFAQAMLHDPDLLILDEPTASLDPVGRKEFRDILIEAKRRGKTVFISSHILSEVESVCDRVSSARKDINRHYSDQESTNSLTVTNGMSGTEQRLFPGTSGQPHERKGCRILEPLRAGLRRDPVAAGPVAVSHERIGVARGRWNHRVHPPQNFGGRAGLTLVAVPKDRRSAAATPRQICIHLRPSVIQILSTTDFTDLTDIFFDPFWVSSQGSPMASIPTAPRFCNGPASHHRHDKGVSSYECLLCRLALLPPDKVSPKPMRS